MALRLVAHFDLDAFFASVEEKHKPWLAGKPVIVGAVGVRGVVSTCNYVARQYGVRSGMAASKARGLCPKGVFIVPSFELYERVSSAVAKTIFEYTASFPHAAFEQASVDEFFVEFACENEEKVEQALELVKKAREEIFSNNQVKCSLGVGANRLVAKMACRQSKPNGFKSVQLGSEREFLAPLQIGQMWGVGEKTRERLDALGVKTIGDLAGRDVMHLIDEFGSYGTWLHFAANGRDDSQVGGARREKSIGTERTFEKDIGEPQVVRAELCSIAQRVHDELQRKKVFFKCVTLKARYSDFKTRTISKTLWQSTCSLQTMLKALYKLLEKASAMSAGKKFRLLGVRASAFTEMENQCKLTEFA